MDFVLLVGGEGFVSLKCFDGWADFSGFRQVAFDQHVEETAKIRDRSVVEAFDNRRALLLCQIGEGWAGEARQAGSEQAGHQDIFQWEMHC